MSVKTLRARIIDSKKGQMYQTRTAYDRGVGTFSPEGRLFQVEYAMKAIEHDSCAIGVQTSEGVVLGVEKRVTSVLLEPESVVKVFEVDSHIGAAVSGVIPDARTLIDHARVECQNHRFTYNEPLKLESLTQSICDVLISFGEGGDDRKVKMSRPFGVSLLLAGWDANGPQLWHTDPSGTATQYAAHAIGNGSEGAQAMLQERYNKSLSLTEARSLVLKILKETMEEKIKPVNVDIIVVTADGYTRLSDEELEPLIASASAESAAEGP